MRVLEHKRPFACLEACATAGQGQEQGVGTGPMRKSAAERVWLVAGLSVEVGAGTMRRMWFTSAAVIEGFACRRRLRLMRS